MKNSEKLLAETNVSSYEIALCDTEAEYLNKAKSTIEKFLNTISGKFKVLIYKKPKDLLADIRSRKISPIMLYIDVELENSSGIKVVEKVNELQKECKVIYLARYLKYATEVYETNHFYFVKKGELKDRLPLIFEKYKSEIKQNDNYFGMPLKNNKYAFIKLADILFFERQGRYTIIHTVDEVYKTKNTLNEIKEKLDAKDFVRCHNSYIVSLNNIKEYQRDRITINEYKVPISRQYQVSTREVFKDYVKRVNS